MILRLGTNRDDREQQAQARLRHIRTDKAFLRMIMSFIMRLKHSLQSISVL
jgi:hypothetical protein